MSAHDSAPPAGAAPTGPVIIDVRPLNGPSLFGMFMNWMFLGIIFCQVLTYHTNYHHRDKFFIKALVYGLLFTEIVFTALLSHFAFGLLIESWGNPVLLVNLPWTVAMITPSSGVVACAVQLFFAWRSWMLTRDWKKARVVTVIIVLLAVFQLSGTIAFTVIWAVKHKLYLPAVRIDPALLTTAYVWLLGSFATDVFIAGMMVTLLYRARRTTRSIKRTDGIINRLIVNAVGTGVVTTAVCLVDLFLFFLPSMANNNYHGACALALGKLYTVTLMANLNGRAHFEGANTLHVNNGPESMEMPTTSSASRTRANHNAYSSQGIIVSTNVDREYDQFHHKEANGKRPDF